jgi:GxxExxY protein
MHKTCLFKFKAPKSNIEYIKKRTMCVDMSPRQTPQPIESAPDRFIMAKRSMSSTSDKHQRPTNATSDIAVNDTPVNNLTRYGLPHTAPACSNPLCYNNRRTNVVEEMKSICEGVYDNWGPGYTEATYEQAIVNEAYNRKIPLLRQASIDVTNGGCSVHAGRIDLEVDGRYLYELKARDPAMDKDRSQISKYIRAYAQNGKNISRAFLVFFTEKRGVIFEEISCDTHHQSKSAINAQWSAHT